MQISLSHGGGLDYLEVAPPGARRDLPLIVVLHGRGASAEDLAETVQSRPRAGHWIEDLGRTPIRSHSHSPHD